MWSPWQRQRSNSSANSLNDTLSYSVHVESHHENQQVDQEPEVESYVLPTSPTLHHKVHGPLNREKALKTGGLCFAPVYSEIDNHHRYNEKWPSQLMSIGLQALTGAITGIFAYLVQLTSAKLGMLR